MTRYSMCWHDGGQHRHRPGPLGAAYGCPAEPVAKTSPQALTAAIQMALATVEHAEARLRDTIATANVAGMSWEDIGEALGTTKQAAWERFANHAEGASSNDPSPRTRTFRPSRSEIEERRRGIEETKDMLVEPPPPRAQA